MQIVVLAGGCSSERDVSLVTGRAIKRALDDLGHTVQLVDPDQNLPEYLCQLKREGVEFVWIALHGAGGEDGTVQAMLDWVGLPYQGSGYLSSALAMDKAVSKQLFESTALPTPAWRLLECSSPSNWSELIAELGSPLVIKPIDGGSSVGVTIAGSEAEFQQGLQVGFDWSQWVLIESYITGKELTISILDHLVMPAIEIVPEQGQFYDYDSKYQVGGSRHLVPCSLNSQSLALAEQVALKAYQTLRCEGLARVDLRIDEHGSPWILEVNTLPGMTPTSLCPEAAVALGWSFTDLVQRSLEQGLQHSTLRTTKRSESPRR